ncbi:hypothetical protein TRVL_00563 [Trypanosoma vivax]|uniref:Uncharacterized protein n=1 Tax=Trypanosoma vivax (strain Y486) TaxID=1055687 RepID=G0U086_TRYVY|nr:hypothetical protein TRVL_00563 [Trypanosoma vivax]CCC49484.1 hypothetical protein, unlikely [Trypanosoma vivax Y486]
MHARSLAAPITVTPYHVCTPLKRTHNNSNKLCSHVEHDNTNEHMFKDLVPTTQPYRSLFARNTAFPCVRCGTGEANRLKKGTRRLSRSRAMTRSTTHEWQ